MTILAALRHKFEQLALKNEKTQLSYAGNMANTTLASAIASATAEDPQAMAYEGKVDTLVPPYKHGIEALDAIYALEKVDPTKIRPMQQKAASGKKASSKPTEESEESQLTFDFKDGWSEKIVAFVLLEPIEFLQIPHKPLQILKEQGKVLIGDLIDTDLNALAFVKGMGQGHIDEIEAKLQSYIQNKKIPFCRHIDLPSWIRSLLIDCSLKKCAALLMRYDLHHLVPVSSAELLELRMLPKEKRRCWEEEASQELASKSFDRFFEQLEHVTLSLFSPWISRRGGIASEEEIIERFYMLIGNDEELLEPVLAFFSDLFCYGRNSLTEKLIRLCDKQYTTHRPRAHDFAEIVAKADSYFPSATTIYPLDALCLLLCKEFSYSWQAYSLPFVRTILKRSDRFLVYKDRHYGLLIRSR
jgi:hypothetical protein